MKTIPGVEVELVEGAGGVFDILVDGELLYSKAAERGRFPDTEREVLVPLRARAG